MKKDFKTKIDEIAANIAGVSEKYDADKVNIPAAVLTRYNSEVVDSKTLATVILDIIDEILAKEPSMQGLEKRSGWNTIMAKLKELQGSAGKDAAPGKDMDMPDLGETFDRINRK